MLLWLVVIKHERKRKNLRITQTTLLASFRPGFLAVTFLKSQRLLYTYMAPKCCD